MPSRLEITKTGGRIVLTAPDHPDLRRRIESLSGVRKGKFWTFAAARELGVRELVRDLYGADALSDNPEDLVRLRVDMYFFGEGMTGRPGEAWLAGRLLACRRDRHDRVDLGEGVSLVSGSFAESAGSSMSPALRAAPGTVLEVRDVARRDADTARRDHSLSVAIVEPFTPATKLPAAPSRGLALPFDSRTRSLVNSRGSGSSVVSVAPRVAVKPAAPKSEPVTPSKARVVSAPKVTKKAKARPAKAPQAKAVKKPQAAMPARAKAKAKSKTLAAAPKKTVPKK